MLGEVGNARDFAIVIGPGRVDAGPDGPAEKAKLFGIRANQVVAYPVVHLRGDLSPAQIEELASKLLVDPVGQWWMYLAEHTSPSGHGRVTIIETGLRPGVTDREAAELVRAANELGLPLESATMATRWLVYGYMTDANVELLAERVLHNTVIERWALDSLPPAHADLTATSPATMGIPISRADAENLELLSKQRRLGLTVDEMIAIQKWFASEGREPTDGELETLAQTWSEHCSHKTFRAVISTPDGEIDGLLNTFLRGATDTINAPWVESAFVDNAGIVNFDSHFDLALKAETHNHPSALEPFGGANTGVGGVVRDILGVSARPVAITDVLCFGPEDLPISALPHGVLHPRRIRSGVIAGVGDYGNKIGVPNLGGAIFHDQSYTTTPLVFAGCVGILPKGSNPTAAKAGDFVVTLGGAVGRDGVGGATFSSQSMGMETALTAGSSVQIGDPVVEKGLIDVVLAARDAGLYTAITDCGAGGLSSAVGEMAETLGADVDLAKVPRKYPGLAPWEVWLSEAQERMVLAVPDPVPFLALAEQWQVDATVIGWFTGEGRLTVRNGDDVLVDLDTNFLHNGRPRLHLDAVSLTTNRPPRSPVEEVGTNIEPVEALKALLSHPSLRSNEAVIRTYDHEVLGGTVIRPYDGVALDGPADGTAFIPPGTDGMRLSSIDTAPAPPTMPEAPPSTVGTDDADAIDGDVDRVESDDLGQDAVELDAAEPDAVELDAVESEGAAQDDPGYVDPESGDPEANGPGTIAAAATEINVDVLDLSDSPLDIVMPAAEAPAAEPDVAAEDLGGPRRAAAIGIGAAILIGRHDCEAMAWAAVDEAIRNVVVAGADPDRLSLLDNFAWGNPTDPVMLAKLVAACRGCHNAAIGYRAPFVSGKDSLFNEFVGPDGVPDPVTPTLIITAVGIVNDVANIPAVGLMAPGNDIWLLGPLAGELGGSYLDEVTGGDRGGHVPDADPDAVLRHREMAMVIRNGLAVSAHDVSEGGIAAAVSEWAFAGRRGAAITLAERHSAYELFGEGLGRYLVEVRPEDGDAFAELAPSATRVGWVTEDEHVRIGTELDISLDEIGRSFKSSDVESVDAGAESEGEGS